MNKMLLVTATGALIAVATAFSASQASAHERCVCTSSIPVPPAPPIAPVPPVPAVPPPVEGRHHIRKQVIIIDPDGERRVSHIDMDRIMRDARHATREARHVQSVEVRRAIADARRAAHEAQRIVRLETQGGNRVVRIVEHREGRMTRKEFMERAEHAFNERDANHDGVIEDDERHNMADADDADDDEDVTVEAPEPPEPPEAVEPPEAPEPPEPPRHHR